MKYRIYIEDSTVDDLVELEGPASPSVIEAGYLEEKTIEADNIEVAEEMAREWASGLSSDVPDYVNVVIEEIETGKHHHLQVWVRTDEK